MSGSALPSHASQTSASPLQVVVVGGGIAGLATAHSLLLAWPELAVTVLESSPATGGKLRLGEVAGKQVDLGAESLLFRRPEAVDLASAVGLGDDVVHPSTTEATIWSRGHLQPLPPTVLGVPTTESLKAAPPVLSARGRWRARLESGLPTPRFGADVAVGRLVARRLGGEVRDRLVEPLLGGVYAGRSDELSLAATMPQLWRTLQDGGGLLAAADRVRAQSRRSPASAPSPVFAGIVGGVGRLAEAVAQDVVRRGGVVRSSAAVRALERTTTGWRVIVGAAAHPQEVLADAVVVAAPAVPAARLLSPVAPVAGAELGRIEYASMAIVTMAFRARDVTTELAGSGFLVPPIEGRAVKASTYSSRKWSWLTGDLMVVRCSLGRHRDEAELHRDDCELAALAVADLRDATGIRAPLVDALVTRWGGGLPQYAVGHLDRVQRIRSAVDAMPGLAVCGAAFDGLGIAAVVASSAQAATQVIDHLEGPRQ